MLGDNKKKPNGDIGGIIYKYTNKINGKIYIGQTKREEPRKHDKNTSMLRFAIDKYGIQSFEVEVIDCANTREVLNEKELYWILLYDCIAPKGYNIRVRGHISQDHPAWNKGLTKETSDIIAKYADILRSRPGHVAWNKGLTKETDKRIKGVKGKRGPNPRLSISKKGHSAWNKGLTKELDSRIYGWRKGLTKETDERVRKIAQANVGKHGEPKWNKGLTKVTDSRVAKVAESNKGKHFRRRMAQGGVI